MKMLQTLIYPLALLTAPAALIAAQPGGEARFDAGVKLPATLIVNNAIWKCADGRCFGPAETRRVALQKACKTLARKVGAVTAISAGGAALADEDLQRCNGTVRVDLAERAVDTVTRP